MKTLAVKYRPKSFSDVVEQDVVCKILTNQIQNNNVKNCYLFCGASGSGKTTSARIFASELNGSLNGVQELDAASHSGADDVRRLIEDAKYKPIYGKYRIYIIDESHALSSQAWQVFLKEIEDPVPTSLYIFCTTESQKIPKTILSRVQRYDFKRISTSGIVSRLKYIIESENKEGCAYTYDDSAITYIAKLAEGGMRSAITFMEKCLGYSTHLSLESVVDSLGTVNYSDMFDLTDAVVKFDKKSVIEIIEKLYNNGLDLKLFIKNYNHFVIDLCKYGICRTFDFIQIPETFEKRISVYSKDDFNFFTDLLNEVINLSADIKWNNSPKPRIESSFILLCSTVN